MARTVRALFDGEVLRPETPIDLEPNTTYVLTVEGEASVEQGAAGEEPYPLTMIGVLAADMGVDDFSIRHDWYARGRAADERRGG